MTIPIIMFEDDHTMLTTLRGLIPRSTWAYGEDLCDGLFNIETVFLHQNDVIDMGTEDCHHLTVCVVGPGAAGKTSLIRKLTGTALSL